jgi:hypothetical protein
VRREDIAFLPVFVKQQRYVGGTVRVIFNGRDLGRNAVFISLEINNAVFVLASAAPVPDGNLALVVASRILFNMNRQAFFRLGFGDFRKIQYRHLSSGRGGGSKSLYAHNINLLLYALENLYFLASRRQRNNGFLAPDGLTRQITPTLAFLRMGVHGVYAVDLRSLKHFFDRFFYLHLCGFGMNVKRITPFFHKAH